MRLAQRPLFFVLFLAVSWWVVVVELQGRLTKRPSLLSPFLLQNPG
jgi:hypothetical protein